MENLKLELIKRFKKDQKALNEYYRLSEDNSKWLKAIIDKCSWPSADVVGEEGEHAAWLIAQHSKDIEFQERCLELMKKLPYSNERKEHIEYLTDRILIKQGKEQKFGTQF